MKSHIKSVLALLLIPISAMELSSKSYLVQCIEEEQFSKAASHLERFTIDHQQLKDALDAARRIHDNHCQSKERSAHMPLHAPTIYLSGISILLTHRLHGKKMQTCDQLINTIIAKMNPQPLVKNFFLS